MGINGLWDILGDGEEHHIADYAADHFKRHGRPLRIAVDEACWRFTNLTDAQVAEIRKRDPRANPMEKTILYRILNLWARNIQLLFVWDGLRKPGKLRKKGMRGGGKVDHDKIKHLHAMFGHLKVPYHQAPGEAEAECARLQQLGVVDAVWSDDCDSFMFGCTTLIRAKKEKGKTAWDKDHIRVYRAEDFRSRLDFDADSFLMCALTAGGDYDEGLKGCGAGTSRAVAQVKDGLAGRMRHLDRTTVASWRADFNDLLRHKRRTTVEVPADFPDLKVLDKYRNPAISSDEDCQNLRRLRHFDEEINHATLRNFLLYYHNFHTRHYMKHFGPVYLMRELTGARTPEDRESNKIYNIRLRRMNAKKDSDGNSIAKTEVRVEYSAHLLVDTDLHRPPDGEDWTAKPVAEKEGVPYNPQARIICLVSEAYLNHGLPEGSLETATSKKKKPAPKKKASDDASPPSTQGLEEATTAIPPDALPPDAGNSTQTKPRKRERLTQESSTKNKPPKKRQKKKAQDEPEPPPSPPRKQFQRRDFNPSPLRPATQVVDLLDDESDDENILPTSQAPTSLYPPTSPFKTTTQLPLPSPSPSAPTGSMQAKLSAPPASPTRTAAPAPALQVSIKTGEVADPATIRSLRAAAFLKVSKGGSLGPALEGETVLKPPKPDAIPNNVIDLTLD